MFLSHCYTDAIDGLLAAVTDLLTHVLTIGKAITNFALQPNLHPLVIHIRSGFNKIDLDGNDQSSITSTLPARFHELLNMFPDNEVRDRARERKGRGSDIETKSTCRSIDLVVD